MPRGRFCALLGLVAVFGCGPGDAPILSAADAKTALASTLDTWKAGKPASELATAKPPIQAVDSDWTAGKVLESYTIGAESEGAGNKTFSVTLNFKGASSASDVKYMVFGTDQVRVYRDIDFERMANMENNPPAPKAKR